MNKTNKKSYGNIKNEHSQFMLKIIKKINFLHLFWTLFYALIFLILLNGGFSYLDPDLGWHLKVGEGMSESRLVPEANIYNYTYTGNWVDHEWLSNFLLYQVYDKWGYEAVVAIFALVITLVFIGLNLFVRRFYGKKPNPYILALLQLFAVLASLPHFGVRIQELSLLFLFLQLVILELYSRSKKTSYLILFIPLFYLWANLHASFVLGLGILFLYLLIKITERLFSGRKISELLLKTPTLKNKDIAYFIIFSLLSLASTMGTPYGLKLYGFLSGYRNSSYLFMIQEWLPQYFYPFHYDQLAYLALGGSALVAVTMLAFKREEKVNLWHYVLSVLFLLLSFKSRRHFPLFTVASFYFVSSFFFNFFKPIKRIAYGSYLKALLLICLFLVIVSKALYLERVKDPFTSFCDSYPCQALDYLQNNPEYLRGNIYNNYDWGGYLIWTMPNKKLFIDGRLPQVEINGTTFIEEYWSFYIEDGVADKKFNVYDVETVLLKKSKEKPKPKNWEKFIFGLRGQRVGKNYLKSYLSESESWDMVFEDEISQIYIKQE